MKIRFLQVSVLFIFLIIGRFNLGAQDNIRVAFENPNGIPNSLTICEEVDDALVLIQSSGNSNGIRTDLKATVTLPKGIRFSGLNSITSSAGVSIDAILSGNRIRFNLPNLNPGNGTIKIGYSIKADCDILDTIRKNNNLEVFDNWSFDYKLGNQSLQESKRNIDYRDALAIPSFSLMDKSTNLNQLTGTRCATRTIQVTNSGLDGFVDTLVYKSTQGKGISITGLRANGVSINFTKNVNGNGDTVLQAIIPGSVFIFNRIGNSLGNVDTKFNSDESMIIEETICLVSCNQSLASNHSVSWGCYGQLCEEPKLFLNLSNVTGIANPIIDIRNNINKNVGYCSPGSQTIRITNQGSETNPGTGAMRNLVIFSGLGNNLDVSSEGFRISSVNIAGRNITQQGNKITLDNNPFFSTDPDGVGGLSDIDGDGFFDDLPIGQSFELTNVIEFDCASSSQVNSINNFNARLNIRLQYGDGCNFSQEKLFEGIYNPINSGSGFTNTSDPDAFAEGSVFFLVHNQTRNISNFDASCSGTSNISVSVTLPQGISISDIDTRLIRNGVEIGQISNISNLGRRFVINFNTNVFSGLNGDFRLLLGLKADCNASQGISNYPLNIQYNCSSCNCSQSWYQGILTGPKIHVFNPPCANAPLCDEGMKTTFVDLKRTTLGFTDATYSSRIM
jgi:hypothetical protein